MKIGDEVTFDWVHPVIPNPDRRWWQFWKPRMMVDKTRLQKFTVESVWP